MCKLHKTESTDWYLKFDSIIEVHFKWYMRNVLKEVHFDDVINF